MLTFIADHFPLLVLVSMALFAIGLLPLGIMESWPSNRRK